MRIISEVNDIFLSMDVLNSLICFLVRYHHCQTSVLGQVLSAKLRLGADFTFACKQQKQQLQKFSPKF